MIRHAFRAGTVGPFDSRAFCSYRLVIVCVALRRFGWRVVVGRVAMDENGYIFKVKRLRVCKLFIFDGLYQRSAT